MKLFEINEEIICLDKVVSFRKKKNSDKILTKYHYYGEDEYEDNPYPYALSVSFLNGDTINYGYHTESERDEVFDKLVQALKEEKAE